VGEEEEEEMPSYEDIPPDSGEEEGEYDGHEEALDDVLPLGMYAYVYMYMCVYVYIYVYIHHVYVYVFVCVCV